MAKTTDKSDDVPEVASHDQLPDLTSHCLSRRLRKTRRPSTRSWRSQMRMPWRVRWKPWWEMRTEICRCGCRSRRYNDLRPYGGIPLFYFLTSDPGRTRELPDKAVGRCGAMTKIGEDVKGVLPRR